MHAVILSSTQTPRSIIPQEAALKFNAQTRRPSHPKSGSGVASKLVPSIVPGNLAARAGIQERSESAHEHDDSMIKKFI